MRKTRPNPLKAKSLADLRDLTRQASGHTRSAEQASRIATSADNSSGDAGVPASKKRRPHRFFPPRPDGHRKKTGKPQAPDFADEDPANTAHRDMQDTDAYTRYQQSVPGTSSSTDTHITTPADSLSAEDIALFRRVVQHVSPAPTTNRAMLPPRPVATLTQLRQRRQHAMGQAVDNPAVMSDQYAPAGIDHDNTVFLQAGHGPHLIKKLKKGQWSVQASLDLHGANLDEARERMDRFIQSCRDHQIRCVRIVHGKGHGSKNGDPVLKDTVRRWLSQLAVVQAYIECDEANGGAGAVLVLLAKPEP